MKRNPTKNLCYQNNVTYLTYSNKEVIIDTITR